MEKFKLFNAPLGTRAGLTDRELQSLRNEGNYAERAADEIAALRVEVERLRAAPAPVALTPAQQHADELVVALRGVMNLHTHNIHTASAWDELLKRARAVLAAIEATGQEGGAA